jgi:Tfp pilus assembly protein PilO
MLQKKQLESFCSYRNAVISGAAILVIVASYNWIVAPQAKHVNAAQRYLSVKGELEKKYDHVKKLLSVKKKRLNGLRDTFNENREYAMLFSPLEAKEFFSDIQSASEECGCMVESLTFSSTGSQEINSQEQEKGVSSRRTSLSVTGTYNDLVTLFNRLQDRLRRVWIHSLNIETVPGATNRLRCHMVVTVCVVHFDEETAAEAAPAAE